jgi:hypothetical protein
VRQTYPASQVVLLTAHGTIERGDQERRLRIPDQADRSPLVMTPSAGAASLGAGAGEHPAAAAEGKFRGRRHRRTASGDRDVIPAGARRCRILRCLSRASGTGKRLRARSTSSRRGRSWRSPAIPYSLIENTFVRTRSLYGANNARSDDRERGQVNADEIADQHQPPGCCCASCWSANRAASAATSRSGRPPGRSHQSQLAEEVNQGRFARISPSHQRRHHAAAARDRRRHPAAGGTPHAAPAMHDGSRVSREA